METTSIITLIILCGIYLNWSIRKLSREDRARQKEHALLLDIERRKQVYYFRLRLMHEFDVCIINHMPSYDEMVASDKPLIASEWVDVDSLYVRERIERGELEEVQYLNMEFSEN